MHYIGNRSNAGNRKNCEVFGKSGLQPLRLQQQQKDNNTTPENNRKTQL